LKKLKVSKVDFFENQEKTVFQNLFVSPLHRPAPLRKAEDLSRPASTKWGGESYSYKRIQRIAPQSRQKFSFSKFLEQN
jgi:hypothetical protein